MKSDERAQKVEELIRSIWSSLESHLRYTHSKSWEGRRFHKTTVKQYATDIKKLTDLL